MSEQPRSGPLSGPLRILQDAIEAVPPVRYALGIAGIASAVALVRALGISLRVAFVGTVVMLLLMTVLVVFARLASLAKGLLRLPALVLTWFSLVLLMVVSALLVSCVFFRQPLDLSRWLDGSGASRISLVALAAGAGTRPVAGLCFGYGGTVSKPTNDGGATELKLPAGYPPGRQIVIDLVETAVIRPERWQLVNNRINVPAPGESAALMLMRRREVYEIADELRQSSTEEPLQAGESPLGESRRAPGDVAARHGLTVGQLQEAIAVFGDTPDAMDRGIALYLQGKYALAEKILSDVAASNPRDLVEASRYLGAAQFAQDKYQAAAETFRKALALRPKDADLYNWLGVCRYTVADLQGAEILYRQAVAIDEQAPAAERANLARDLNDLAQVLQDTNRFGEAERLMRRALAIDEQRFGRENPHVATEVANLGLLLFTTSRVAEAEPLLRRALAIDRRAYGPAHPEVAVDLNNLAELLVATNRLAEAEPLLRQALAIDEGRYGHEYSSVGRDLSNLAHLLVGRSRVSEAEPLIRRALAIDERVFGPEHPSVATRLNILARLLLDTGRLAEAEPLARRALAIDEASYGPEHPDVATDLALLGRLLQTEGRLAEAEGLVRRALAVDQKLRGPQHASVATDLDILASLLAAAHRRGEAELLLRQALAIDEKRLGPSHPNVARDLRDLGRLLLTMNRPAEAELLVRRALAIDEASYGPEYPDVARDLDNLAKVLAATHRSAEAESLLRRALVILSDFTQLSGYSHPELERVRQDYSALLRKMGRSQGEIDTAITSLTQPLPVSASAQENPRPQ
jgi:tetratricopeptide (TPR) repeat protein